MKKQDYDISDSIEMKMPIINAEFERQWERCQKGRMKGSKYLAKKFFLSAWCEGMWAQYEVQRSGTNLTKTQEEAVSKIKYLATDKRIRVLKDDCIEWLETKMKEINKQAKKISKVRPWEPDRYQQATIEPAKRLADVLDGHDEPSAQQGHNRRRGER